MGPVKIDIVKIDRDARKLRAEYSRRLMANAGAWISRKFAGLMAQGEKMGGKTA